MYDEELTMEEYLDSRIISTPYKLYDCCLESEGACAVVITSAENAEGLEQPPVRIESAVQGGGDRGSYLPNNIKDYGTSWTKELADRLYRQADIGPSDIDVAQIYENFTPQVMMTMEDFGLAERGEAGKLFAEGETLGPDGDLPVNTSGGNLSEAYIHGFQLIAEAARQIRGTSTCQVDDVEYSLVAAGNVNPTSGLLLSPLN
jgi:acetyl-CoA acetyltransferase